ncbi:MAG: RNA polymerase sigma factor [Firmicutes bacterium]|nr:RNA polymerase sigma factor [Dethiobacter sp.]MBS3889832.1 RNA polymerase sigma factor [Bacillota bacterium]MBS4054341.1 RNA polymerase sigma factor [Thermaerobacter sp.]
MHARFSCTPCTHDTAAIYAIPRLRRLQALCEWFVFLLAGSRLSAEELEQERALVEQARTDPAAFGRLYEDNYDRILNFVVRRTADVELAQDITSETFLKAFKNLAQFTWQNVPFQAWLFRIALTEIAGWHRKKRYPAISLTEMYEQGFEPAGEQDIEAELLLAEAEVLRQRDFLLLQEQMHQLPENYREVLFLRFFAELPLQEIGTVLGKPTGTIKSLLHRGLEKLRQKFARDQKHATQSDERHYTGRGLM